MTADIGYSLSVDQIDWTVAVKRTSTAANAHHYSLFYVSDQSDFSNILAQSGDLAQTAAAAPHATLDPVYNYDQKSFSFTGLNLTGYQTLYFAIESSINTSTGAIDPIYHSFEVQGTAVPEPSSFAMLGLGFGTLLLRRKKGN